MSYIVPNDIGSSYGYMAHSMEELLLVYKNGQKPNASARLPNAVASFFQHVDCGSTSSGSLNDMVHYRLAHSALDSDNNTSLKDADKELDSISQNSMRFLDGMAKPQQVLRLRDFFTRLRQISQENYDYASVTGRPSSYTFV